MSGPQSHGEATVTAAPTVVDAYATARRAFARGEWRDGAKAFADAQKQGSRPAASDRLLLQIARIRLAATPDAAPTLEADLIRQADGRDDVRRHLIAPWLKAGELARAADTLSVVVDAYPQAVEERSLLVSLLIRLARWDEAVRHAEAAAALAPDDLSAQAAHIRCRLQAGDTSGAAEIAQAKLGLLATDSSEARVFIAALLRGGAVRDAAQAAGALDPARFPDASVAAAAVQALLSDEQFSQAVKAGEAALAAGLDSPGLRSHIGQAILMSTASEDRTSRAIEHLAAGAAQAPDNVRINSLYGDALLQLGRYEEAIAPLEKVCTLQPHLDQSRALYTRALKHAGRHSESADNFMKLLKTAPEPTRWYRQAVGALTQAGRAEEASALFETFVSARAAALPATFEAALAELPARAEAAIIPQARLDWAWTLRTPRQGEDRAEWERAARWGYVADQLILDWLECRDHQAEEVMGLLVGLDETEAFLEPLRGKPRGFVIATAHVGPMYAGPLILELVALPSRWLASTPSIAQTSYASTLISTSDQTDAQIVKASLKALQTGYSIGLAVEGAASPSAPRIRFEGQQITYSSFAARAAHRARVPSIFYAPRWEDGRINVTLKLLPPPEPEEDVGTFAARWRDAYLGHLRDHLRGEPENLRLSGGLWRHIRSPGGPRV